MSEKDSYLVCMPTEILREPSVPSFRDHCVKCEAEVWRSNRSASLKAVPLCMRCTLVESAAARGRGEPLEFEPPPYLKDDLATWNGGSGN